MIGYRLVYVARYPSGKFAVEGRETGMGRSIESTDDVWRAKQFASPDGIVSWAGGHADGMEAVELKISFVLGDVVPKKTAAEHFGNY